MKLFENIIKKLNEFIICEEYEEDYDFDDESQEGTDAADTSSVPDDRTSFRRFMDNIREYALYDVNDDSNDDHTPKLFAPGIASPKISTHLKHRGDFVLTFFVALTALIGLVVLYGLNSADIDSSYYVSRQALYLIMGVAIATTLNFVDYHSVLRMSWWVFAVACILGILTLFVGVNYYGSRRAILIGLFSINTGILMNIAVVLLLASILSREEKLTLRVLMKCAFVAGTAAVIAVIQGNMPVAVLILLLALALLFIKKPLWTSIITIASIALMIYVASAAVYGSSRISAWLDPFGDRLDTGYQTVQSLYAIADGGLFGKGIGQNTGVLTHNLPDSNSGYFLASISYQMGLIGSVVVLLLLIMLVWRIARTALRSRDSAGFYLCAAICAKFTISIILNTLVVVNLIPPAYFGGLPFVSYNGSSLIIDAACIGIVLNVSKYTAGSSILRKGGSA
jgi:cell division protein FtsW